MQTETTKNPIAEWQLLEDTLAIEKNVVQETLFTLGNGYLGLRGAHEEGFAGTSAKSLDGTFINGFYETSPIHHPETAYAYAKNHQFMLNVPNGKRITFSIDDEEFNFFTGKIISYKRAIDFRTGILHRDLEWLSPKGHHLIISTERIVSFQRKNIYALQYKVKSVNFSGTVTVKSTLDGKVKNVEAGDDPRFGAAVSGQPLQLISSDQADDFSALIHRTKNSGLVLVSAIENEFTCGTKATASRKAEVVEQKAEQVYSTKIEAGETVCLTKYGCYFTSREHPEDQLLSLSKKALAAARKTGFATLCSEQAAFLSDFWKHADITITGEDSLQQGVHFNQFHLLQSVGRDGKTSIAAKGLTGEGYGGHYFWDAEIYALPFYLYSRPEIARAMLEYRYSILDKARERAREMSHEKGALFAWRTISGEECSAFFLAGTAQYHINADIAFAIKQYYEATDDEEFMSKYGAETVLETARVWMDIGTYVSKRNNQFCINGVTGPDEYTVLVDNNFYTNAMAQMHLRFAHAITEKMKKDDPTNFLRISKLMNLTEAEPKEWLKAADSMFLPFDKELGIHPQDDTFLTKKKWDMVNTPKEKHPLLLHYHYLVIYRHQVCKQADVVLAIFLLGNQFALSEKKNDYDYYEAITTHDSSLSPCTFSIVASEVGYHEKAYKYLLSTARADLDDNHGNTSHGVHIAAMAGTWMAIVYGFAGVRVYDGKLQFAPQLPEQWQEYSFRFYFKSSLLQIKIDKKEVQYSLLEGKGAQFKHFNEQVQLTKADPTKVVSLVTKQSGATLAAKTPR